MPKVIKPTWILALALISAAFAPSVASAQDAKPLCREPTRACVEKTVRAYFDGLLKADGAAVPFASDVRVTEQGKVLLTSRAAFLSAFKASSATKGFRNVRMVVDEKAGEAAIFMLADVRPDIGEKPYTVRRAQRMKIVNGLITEVELLIYVDQNPAALWPDK